jgi:hypothetical protein
MTLKAGFYWARSVSDKSLTVVELYANADGSQHVMFMGNLQLASLEDASQEVLLLARIPEPGTT